jgi:hypothetical protein
MNCTAIDRRLAMAESRSAPPSRAQPVGCAREDCAAFPARSATPADPLGRYLHDAFGFEFDQLALLRNAPTTPSARNPTAARLRRWSTGCDFSAPGATTPSLRVRAPKGAGELHYQEDRFHLRAGKQDHGGDGDTVATAVERSSRTKPAHDRHRQIAVRQIRKK